LGFGAESGAMNDVEAVFFWVSGKPNRQWTAGSARGPVARSRCYFDEVGPYCDALGSCAAKVCFRRARWNRTTRTPSYGSTEPAVLDRTARNLKPLFDLQLRTCRLDASRFVLAGFGYGGTLALHMSLRLGLSCAGVLAFGAKLMHPLPRMLRADNKIRLIQSVDDHHIGHRRLRDGAAALAARGVDTQEVLLVGEFMSDEAVRHGSAYLKELVGNAQQEHRPQLVQERRYAQ